MILQRERRRHGLKRLEGLGSRENLGMDFNVDHLYVPCVVADRVQFLDRDALSAIQHISGIDLIGDFFLQVNLNKDENPDMGLNYTRRLVDAASQALAPEGFYLIGDTGRNLPVTFCHLARLSQARLHISSLVHAVNRGGPFITSSYLVVSKMEDVCSKEMIEAARSNIANKPGLKDLQVREEKASVEDLIAITKTRLHLAYISTGKDGVTWNTVGNLQQSLSQLLPRPASSVSQTIVLPAQKAELEVTI